MKITTLTFEKRWNLGDYNHENLAATAGVEENENPSAALKDLISFVRSRGAEEVPVATQSAPPTKTATAAETKVTKVEKETKKEKKPTEAKETKAAGEQKQVEETGKDESNGEEKSKNETQSETKGSEEKKPETKKVVSKGKGVPYDPDNNLHKKLVGEFLDKAQPSWRANTAPAKAVSQILRGVEFQDSEGLIVEEFKNKFLEELKSQKA